jgi:hypothetical protein
MYSKPKRLRGLDQKVSGQVQGFRTSLAQTLPHRRRGGTYSTLGHLRNVVSPLLSLWVGVSQEPPMRQRVKEEGESEGHAVMAWIGVASHPTRKRADFPLVFRHERV